VIHIARPAPAVVLLTMTGRNVDDLTDALTRELETDVVIQGPIQLFVDARGSVGAAMMLSHRWGRWFRDHREHLSRVVLLTGEGFVKMTGEFVRTFAGLDDRLEIVLSPDAFDRIKTTAQRAHQTSGTWMRAEAADDT
jgi:hypothetical protein